MSIEFDNLIPKICEEKDSKVMCLTILSEKRE